MEVQVVVSKEKEEKKEDGPNACLLDRHNMEREKRVSG